MHLKFKFTILLFIVLFLSFALPQLAFADTFTLSGNVKDSSNHAISGATVAINDTNNDSTTTDSSGNYNISIPTGTYNVQVTPPSGSGLSSAIALNQNISTNTTLNFALTPNGTITLSGHVYDSAGHPVSNQQVIWGTATAFTDASGSYSLQSSSGTNQLTVTNNSSRNNDFSLNVPADYNVYKENYTLTQDTILDVHIPLKQVTVHIQDASGNSVSNVTVRATVSPDSNYVNNGGLSIGGGITTASSDYSNYDPGPQTDSSGNVILWLLPNSNNYSYDFTATPLSGGIYSIYTLNNVQIISNQTKVFSLQYNHATPTTTATLSPSLDNQGNYSDPTTVTLTATAASGYSVVNTYYTIDDGSQQTYSDPFSVSGSGNHTITYWSVDNSGVIESHNTKTFSVVQNNSLVSATNAGGSASGNFVSDTNFNGGRQYSSGASVDTSGIDTPAPQSVYQTVRYGNFTYTIPNLTANAAYTLKLHFNELYWGTSLAGGGGGIGSRVFNVSVNGTQVLHNYDIYQTAGDSNKAVVEQIPATADSNGHVTLQFSTVTDNAMVNGIEIYSGTLPSPTPTPTPTPVSSLSINAGSTTVSSFVSDKDFSGGQPYTSSANVDTTGVTSPAPESVYQSVRYGNFTYTVPNLYPNTQYTVKLHFNELYWGTSLSGNAGGVGSRVFDTSINGQQVLNNYDIYADVGGSNKAVVKQFTATSNAQGKISIVFTTVTDNAMVNGIEISQ
ncbi:MAG TPA: malectin domain-containing carbohydrate-binding protein [Candidatus Saccharimonadales bacterium]|nr:malectin domain-containing carbohydrate-binding protein [Candidatus Saccharimonadales bacterium]